MKPFYPVMLDLSGRPCIVIGGGKIAGRKIESLMQAEADIKVISPAVTSYIEDLAVNGVISWEKRGYQKGDLEGVFLIVAATDNTILNKEIYHDANHAVQFINVIDSPELCTFIVPSSLNRGHLQIAVSTHGASPGLAKRIRQELEQHYGEEYVQYTDFLSQMRQWILQNVIDPTVRKNYFELLLSQNWLDKIVNGEREQAEVEIKSIFTKASNRL